MDSAQLLVSENSGIHKRVGLFRLFVYTHGRMVFGFVNPANLVNPV